MVSHLLLNDPAPKVSFFSLKFRTLASEISLAFIGKNQVTRKSYYDAKNRGTMLINSRLTSDAPFHRSTMLKDRTTIFSEARQTKTSSNRSTMLEIVLRCILYSYSSNVHFVAQNSSKTT